MLSDKHRWRGVLPAAVGVTAAVAVTAAVMPWSNAETGDQAADWEVVHGSPEDGGQFRALTVAEDQAWAFGNENSEGTGQTRIDHFDGTQWSTAEVPEESEFTPESADSSGPDNVWAIGSGSEGSEVLRYDGEDWTHSPVDSFARQIEVVAADDVWTMDDNGETQRFDGSEWSEAPGPGASSALDSLAADEIYAVGANDLQPAVEQWDGQEWTAMDVPEVDLGDCESAGFDDVVAKDSEDIWAAGAMVCASENGSDQKPLLAHWNGSEWDVTVEDEESSVGYYEVADDGDNGVWVSGYNEYIHYSADGETTAHEIAPEGVQSPTLANIPGSTAMIGTASVYEDGSEGGGYGIALAYTP